MYCSVAADVRLVVVVFRVVQTDLCVFLRRVCVSEISYLMREFNVLVFVVRQA